MQSELVFVLTHTTTMFGCVISLQGRGTRVSLTFWLHWHKKKAVDCMLHQILFLGRLGVKQSECHVLCISGSGVTRGKEMKAMPHALHCCFLLWRDLVWKKHDEWYALYNSVSSRPDAKKTWRVPHALLFLASD